MAESKKRIIDQFEESLSFNSYFGVNENERSSLDFP